MAAAVLSSTVPARLSVAAQRDVPGGHSQDPGRPTRPDYQLPFLPTDCLPLKKTAGKEIIQLPLTRCQKPDP